MKKVAIVDRGDGTGYTRYGAFADGEQISSSNALRVVLDDVREYFKNEEAVEQPFEMVEYAKQVCGMGK